MLSLSFSKLFNLALSNCLLASKQFDSARLNNFEKLNDSNVVAYITPENTPINNSTYYAFSIWSKVPRTFYLLFKYPKGYTHRYRPKIKINNKWSLIDTLGILKKNIQPITGWMFFF